ncbi:MAG: hypothetical protein FWG14_03880 [Peptococcaceae bacterium]|nr:hypothetical protein [Peptococcaceae bacterium]
MAKNKKILIIAAISGVVVVSAALLTVFFIRTNQEQSDTEPSTFTPPIVHEATSSQFGKRIDFPNTYEGRVWAAWLDTYPIGKYKAEYRNYDDVLAKTDVTQRIAAVIDPSLTTARNKFPNAEVRKNIYNGFMTVHVHPFPDGNIGGLDEAGNASIRGEDQPVYALNFDLHTGEQIDLRSVFADNFDAQTAVDGAVQSYVLTYDEQNSHKFKGVDLGKTQFTPALTGIWLIFDEDSLFLAGKSIYLEWYRFGDGAVAIFDRFARLDASEMALGDDSPGYYDYDAILLYRSEPRYLVAQNTDFYLPTHYENDYERELAEKAKQTALSNLKSNQNEAPMEGFLFARIGDYRCVDVRSEGVWNGEKSRMEYSNSLIGIFNIKEKREITLAEYYGDDYAQQFLALFHEDLAAWGNRRALVTDQEFLDLAKTVKVDFIQGTLIFARSISADEFPNEYSGEIHEQDTLYLRTQKEWWR